MCFDQCIFEGVLGVVWDCSDLCMVHVLVDFLKEWANGEADILLSVHTLVQPVQPTSLLMLHVHVCTCSFTSLFLLHHD